MLFVFIVAIMFEVAVCSQKNSTNYMESSQKNSMIDMSKKDFKKRG